MQASQMIAFDICSPEYTEIHCQHNFITLVFLFMFICYKMMSFRFRVRMCEFSHSSTKKKTVFRTACAQADDCFNCRNTSTMGLLFYYEFMLQYSLLFCSVLVQTVQHRFKILKYPPAVFFLGLIGTVTNAVMSSRSAA